MLARVKSNLILKPIERLSDGSYLTKIYRNSYDRSKDRNGIFVRVIRYKQDDPQRTGHDEEHELMTTLLDHTTYPASELISLYHERWEQELTYDEQKTHQDPRRASKPAHLRSQTPSGVIQEWYENLLWEMPQEVLEPRRNRINPRVIKQKIRKWPKKQTKHRKPPKLTKTFEESVLIT